MLLTFTEQEYESIPRPRTTWVVNLVREALGKFKYDAFGNRKFEFAFELRTGEVLTGWGVTKMEALLSTGRVTEREATDGRVKRHATVEEAKAAGWYREARPDVGPLPRPEAKEEVPGAGNDYYPVVPLAPERPTRKRVSAKGVDPEHDGSKSDGLDTVDLGPEPEATSDYYYNLWKLKGDNLFS